MAFDRDELLEKLARALAKNPGSSMKELAEEVGISKASLHRIYSTRESLCQTLVAQTKNIFDNMIDITSREHNDFLADLKELISFHVENSAFVLFIGRDAFVRMIDEADWVRYDEELAAFFRAGKDAGLLLGDFSSEEMRDIFVSLVVGLLEYSLWGSRSGKAAEGLIYKAVMGGISSKGY